MPSKRPNREAQQGTARKEVVDELIRVVRRHGLDYAALRYCWTQIREQCGLHPQNEKQDPPAILTDAQFAAFFQAIDRDGDAQHALMMRTLFFSAVRVSELCKIEVADVDLTTGRTHIRDGKGHKDRYTLLPEKLLLALRVHVQAHPRNRYLFQTRRNTRYSTRRVQEIVQEYASKAGVDATPHTFRHQALTWLTERSGLSDAQIRLLSGHSSDASLAIYQHVAINGTVKEGYEKAMNAVPLDGR